MNPNIANVIAWSYGLAGVAALAFALKLGFSWRGGLRSLALQAAVALTALWGFLGLTFALTGSGWALAGAGLADVLSIGGWYAFLLLLIARPHDDPVTVSKPGVIWLVSIAVAIVLYGLAAAAMSWLRVAPFGSPERLALFDALAAAVFGLVLLEQLFRNVAKDARWNIKPLCLGLGGAFVFDVYLFADALLFNRLDIDVWSVRGFVHALAIPLVAMSSVRSRDWTFRIGLSRRVAFRSAVLLVSGVYLLFMAAAGYYVRFFGGEWGRALQVALVCAGLFLFGLLAFSGAVRAKLRVLISKNFFSYRYDYRDEWLKFTQSLSSHDSELDLGQHVVKGLADMVESPAGALWQADASGRTLVQRARWNMPAIDATEVTAGALCQFLIKSGWVINLEEYRSSPDRYAGLERPVWLSGLPSAWLIVPLSTGRDLVGFVVLATARTHVDVNWEVTDLLKTAGRQAASFLGQMQAAESLLEARKFEAFNSMSAFVVHDLRTLVAQLTLMLKNFDRHQDNPEFQKDMLDTVRNVAARMNNLMLQLRVGTAPIEMPKLVNLGDVVRRIEQAKSLQGRPIGVEATPGILAVGHEERLEHVIGHLVQNAIDATASGGRVTVRAYGERGEAVVQVSDDGVGMTPEFVADRLFRPFQTTKAHGMGIGMYESQQYIQGLGGRILVESAPGAGTRVRITLPNPEPECTPLKGIRVIA